MSFSVWAQDATVSSELIKRGEYLARAGDCVACHTDGKSGKPFAGGLPMETPIGAIYSTNITPDRKTGIGDYSFEDFDRAVRQGVAKNGDTLYPAMPYPSYARVSEEDMRAMYAYFMHGVQPVEQANKACDIPWPLSMRWPLASGAACLRRRRRTSWLTPKPIRCWRAAPTWWKAWATAAPAIPRAASPCRKKR